MDKNEGRKELEGFFQASALGNTADCKKWIRNGIPINSRNRFGHTALMVAAVNGQFEVAELLLKYRADPTSRDNWGYTALMKAAASGHSEIFKLLRNHNRSLTCDTFLGNVTALAVAALNGRNDIIELCLAQNDQLVDEPVELTRMTPLMLAVVGRHPATVEFLLKNEAKLDAVNSASQTAMDIAQHLRDDRIIRKLNDFSRAAANRASLETGNEHVYHEKGLSLTPTSRFPRRIEVKCFNASTSIRRSKSKERPKAKRNIISKSDRVFHFILQSEGLGKLWDVFSSQEIDLKTFFSLNREDFISIGITEEPTISNLLTASHHYKPLFSI